MEVVGVLLDVLILITIVLGGLLLRNYLPSYLDKKGENLATKEDVQEITRLTESVQKEFRQEFEDYSKDRSFKYQYHYNQFRELYTNLYCIIAQSEYLRYFFNRYKNSELGFDDIPFIELQKAKYTVSSKKEGDKITILNKKYTTTDVVTEFNKKELFTIIIDKGEFASQRLLKLAIAYRFVHQHYAGTDETSDIVEEANNEEFVLIKEMIQCIISEYNYLRKELKLDYVETELTTGIFENININNT